MTFRANLDEMAAAFAHVPPSVKLLKVGERHRREVVALDASTSSSAAPEKVVP